MGYPNYRREFDKRDYIVETEADGDRGLAWLSCRLCNKPIMDLIDARTTYADIEREIAEHARNNH